MEVRSGTVAGRSQEGYRLSRGNDVARLHQWPVEVPVQRAELGIAHDQQVQTVAATLSVKTDDAARRCVDGRAEWRGQIDAAVEMVTGACRGPRLDLQRGAAEGLGQG